MLLFCWSLKRRSHLFTSGLLRMVMVCLLCKPLLNKACHLCESTVNIRHNDTRMVVRTRLHFVRCKCITQHFITLSYSVQARFLVDLGGQASGNTSVAWKFAKMSEFLKLVYMASDWTIFWILNHFMRFNPSHLNFKKSRKGYHKK